LTMLHPTTSSAQIRKSWAMHGRLSDPPLETPTASRSLTKWTVSQIPMIWGVRVLSLRVRSSPRRGTSILIGNGPYTQKHWQRLGSATV
jgi:hypothetical protein